MPNVLPRYAGPAPEIAGQEAAADPLLDHLRAAARAARCRGPVDLFGACAALSTDRDVAARAAADVLMRCLAQALGRRPVFLRAGERERTFDETWLLALARSLQAGDASSAAFLLRSRVPHHAQRNLAFLIRTSTECFARD